MKSIYFIIGLLAFLGACNGPSTENKPSEETVTMETMKEKDIHSYSNPSQVVVKHLDWVAEVNFDSTSIEATAILTIDNLEATENLVLDINGLSIASVVLDGKEAATFTLGEHNEIFGQSLTIPINPETKLVSIKYTTDPNAQALQWLNPSQTAGKEQPFLFTQSQSILARSWIPLQDSPGVRFTYNAKVQVPSNLLAVMSASNPQQKNNTGLYEFEMKQPIPSYLMALSVGDIVFREIGERSGVYAEPSVVDKAAYEFEDLESMIAAAEALYGPYAWDRYDIIVLPPSFPFGGMENPRLTFATPTILAGDKSLVSLVAHELAHSWSGNLVTNATWNDFWLNEGFTVYFEHRIMESVYGRDYSEMLASLALQDLKSEIHEMEENGQSEDTKLKLNLEGRSSDDGMTAIAYDKGYMFLRYLEEQVGRERFDVFLKNYFTSNAFSVMDTETFLTILDKDLFESNGIERPAALYEEWVYGVGLPEGSPEPTSNRFEEVEKQLGKWQEKALLSDLEVDAWTTHEWLHFLRSLPENLTLEQMAALDAAFGFTNSGNSEITMAWMLHVIANGYTPGYEKLETFLIETGRRKFLTPLYKAMLEKEDGKTMANAIYSKARPNYHFVATNTMDALLNYTSK